MKYIKQMSEAINNGRMDSSRNANSFDINLNLTFNKLVELYDVQAKESRGGK